MDEQRFQRVLMSYLVWIYLLALVFLLLASVAYYLLRRDLLPGSGVRLFGLPLVSIDGSPRFSGRAGPAVVSAGGLAIGVLAFGGTAFGIIAVGGGAVGLIAIGGGAVGLLAIGGGACGYIAVGGGAWGVYVLAGDGAGRYVLSRKRQDPKAVQLFCRYLPRLRNVLQRP